MTTYVVDASVILKWVLGDEREADQERAMALLHAWGEGRCELAAPCLWVYETGNILGRLLDKAAQEKMEMLLNLGIQKIEPTPGMTKMIFSWMTKNAVTFYDAAYLAAAYDRDAILVTADRAFARKMEREEKICLLQDLKL
ncbi:MAG: type II toxin-antitoxin system VapC family toxin [Syntrophaceae bacterium]|nr:type II toxin-antitoxin system VapC family toxin [Syntrophaceae bacterium]